MTTLLQPQLEDSINMKKCHTGSLRKIKGTLNITELDSLKSTEDVSWMSTKNSLLILMENLSVLQMRYNQSYTKNMVTSLFTETKTINTQEL